MLAASWTAKHLGEIRPEDLARFVDERRTGGASGPTCNRDLSIISTLYRWAIRLRYADENPASRKSTEWCSERGRERLSGSGRGPGRGARETPFFAMAWRSKGYGFDAGDLESPGPDSGRAGSSPASPIAPRPGRAASLSAGGSSTAVAPDWPI